MIKSILCQHLICQQDIYTFIFISILQIRTDSKTITCHTLESINVSADNKSVMSQCFCSISKMKLLSFNDQATVYSRIITTSLTEIHEESEN